MPSRVSMVTTMNPSLTTPSSRIALDEGNEAAHSDVEGWDSEEEDDDDDDDGESEAGAREEPLWYEAIKGFINHVRKVSKDLCKHPGWVLSIDEMFRKFKGRSAKIYGWVENQVVLMVSTIHDGAEYVIRSRKRPPRRR